jgi:hypothetical protein
MSLYATPKAIDVELSPWKLLKDSDGDVHFVGDDGIQGRVSTKIVKFNQETMSGETQSGSTYKCVGRPGFTDDSGYAWGAWLRYHGLTEAENADVSETFSV